MIELTVPEAIKELKRYLKQDFYTPKNRVAHRMAIEALENTDWIPVQERLPEPCVRVLSNNGICVNIDWYDDGFGCWYSEIEQVPIPVTHWMPLPKTPHRGGE